ncbi:MAG: hypothetical protein HY288_17435 [Planctomycetia bacterium]|nr:hypothetical protein [Planctomycetia bacterium]
MYIKGYPFSIQEAKTKYSAAMAAGIDQLKSFPPQHPGGDVTAVTIGIRGQVTTVEIPEFYGKGKENNNIGSENHQRFLAVKKIVDDFDTDAFLLDSE